MARKNTTWKMTDVEKLCVEAVNKVTPGNWKDVVQKVIKIENDYWWRDGILEERVPKFF